MRHHLPHEARAAGMSGWRWLMAPNPTLLCHPRAVPATSRLATSTPHTITTHSPAAAITASARLRWYFLPSGVRDHHWVSQLPGFCARPVLPAAAEEAGLPTAPAVIAAPPAQQVRCSGQDTAPRRIVAGRWALAATVRELATTPA